MFWQSSGIAGIGAPTEAKEVAYVVMDWQYSDHHHHDDGVLHDDDTGGHVQQNARGQRNQFPRPADCGLEHVALNTLRRTGYLGRAAIPLSFTQGLLRPLRTRA